METNYEKNTGYIYGSLFTNYNEKLFDDSVELFFKRHKMWGIDTNWFKDKICLDAGCGGGRFVAALARCGARKVHGVDISEKIIEAGRERCRVRQLNNVEFQRASVLELPFADASFDYVLSSGVIHHTPDPYKGFLELSRVLKPGGKLFLSVYGKHGLKWYANDLFRYTICKIMPFSWLEAVFKAIGVPANKRYNILDNLFVPYCYRYTEKEVRKWLSDAGYTNVQRVKFERYDYQTLKSRILYGVGWIQIYADKK